MLLGLSYKIHKDAEYSSILQRLKDLKWLLRYDHVKKVAAVRRLVSVVGLRSAIRVLSVYYRVK